MSSMMSSWGPDDTDGAGMLGVGTLVAGLCCCCCCCCRWRRINIAGVAGSLFCDWLICGAIAGDFRAGGSAGGGIKGSERDSGETES